MANFYNDEADKVIKGKSSNDSIHNDWENVTIDGGAGNDFIYNGGYNVSINAGAGNDTIHNESENVTISGGKGNDFIHSYGENILFKYSSGDGNDTIEGFDEDDTLQLVKGTVDSVSSNGVDIVLTVGKNSITFTDTAWLERLNIVDAKGKLIDIGIIDIQGTDGDDNISTNVSNKVIRAGKGKDTISNSGDKVTIEGGDGDKTIYFGGDENIINMGNGNNNIIGGGNNLSINTGNGNNYIDSNGIGNSITTGKGKDTVHSTSNDSDQNIISTGGGSDYVNNNGSNTKVDLGGGNDYSYGCPNTRNNAVNGRRGKDTLVSDGSTSTLNGDEDNDEIYSRGKGTNSNGGSGKDKLYNGDSDDVGDDIRNQRDTALEDAENLLNNEINELPEKEQNALYELFKLGVNITDNTIDAIAKKYNLDAKYLTKKYNDIIDLYSDKVLLKNYPRIEDMYFSEWKEVKPQLERVTKKAEKFADIAKKYGKKVKYLGSAIEAIELGWAIGNAITGRGTVDNVVLEAIDLGTSFIPIPFADMLAAEALKGAYKAGSSYVRKYTAANSKRNSQIKLMAFGSVKKFL